MKFQSTLPTRGSDGRHGQRDAKKLEFQSTLPTRGSDPCQRCAALGSVIYFNPRSPRGGATFIFLLSYQQHPNFNTRSPRGGATLVALINHEIDGFQSTLPTRGSDKITKGAMKWQLQISIHAPHEGERPKQLHSCSVSADFNPRSPRGGATPRSRRWSRFVIISIHAPHEGERRTNQSK